MSLPNTTDSRDFHLGDVLSITTGALVSPDHIGGVYAICDYMLGTQHFTHQLPRASDDIKPHLLAQHPELEGVEAPEFEDEAHVWRWLAEQVDRFGMTLTVKPVHEPVNRNSIEELREMRPNAEIITVELPEADDE